jgi:hypothetical protein
MSISVSVREIATTVSSGLLLWILGTVATANVRKFLTNRNYDGFLDKWAGHPAIVGWCRRMIAGWEPLRKRWWLWLALGLSAGVAATLWTAPWFEQGQERAAQHGERNPDTVRQLQTYYAEADDQLRAIIDALDGTDENFKAVKKETDKWSEGMGHWVIDNMGMPAYHRLIQFPTEPNYSNGINKERNSLLFVMTTLRDNLGKLVENRSWDKQ